MPCAYDYTVIAFFRRIDGYIQWRATFQDPAFVKRLKWITACGQVASFRLHHFDYLRANLSRYLVQVQSIYVPKRYPWGWALDSMYLSKPTCYYLGSYSNQWNRSNKKIVFAHDLMTADSGPMGSTPSIAGTYLSQDEINEFNSLEEKYGKQNVIYYLYPEYLEARERDEFFSSPNGYGFLIDSDIDRMVFFQTKIQIVTYLREKYALEERMTRHKGCIAKHFPSRKPKPQYKIVDPEGAKDFPGIPIEEMQPPTPERAPSPGPIPGRTVIRMTLAMGIINFAELRGWSLIVNVSQE